MTAPFVVLAAYAGAALLVNQAREAFDRSFLERALMSDNSEIILGRMAEAEGATAVVRSFGQRIRTDHAAAKARTLSLAQSRGVAVADVVAPDAKAEASRLKQLHGPSFDREFARFMVKDHQKDLSVLEKEARSSDAPAAGFARDTLPGVRRHLELAEKLGGL